MEKRKWLSADWGLSETNRRVKSYSLTPEGRQQLQRSTGIWSEYADAVAKVLQS
jgi:DNA-binding PadR family transcriptional regulator